MSPLLSLAGPDINMGIFAGIIAGLLAATLYNKYNDIGVPDILGFFGGKRFVPIVTPVAALVIGIIAGFLWHTFKML